MSASSFSITRCSAHDGVRERRVRPARAAAQHCARPRAEIRAEVDDLLKLVQLDWSGNRYPSQLSGGQRQRVALARALAVEPKVLLLDEPFGALDAKVREELRRWLRRLHDELHITSIFVTHDQEEALEVANRVVVLNNGKIEQAGTPEELYHQSGDAVRLQLPRQREPVPRARRGRPFYMRGTSIALARTATRPGQCQRQGRGVYVRPHLLDIASAADCEGARFAATVKPYQCGGAQGQGRIGQPLGRSGAGRARPRALSRTQDGARHRGLFEPTRKPSLPVSDLKTGGARSRLGAERFAETSPESGEAGGSSFEHRRFARAQPRQALIRVVQAGQGGHGERQVQQSIPVER